MAKSTAKNNYLVQGSILAFASILSRFIGMLYRIPLTNIIGDTGMGYYSSAYELYNLALILSSYSIPIAVSKLVSARESKKQYRNAFRVFQSALVVAVVVGAAASLLVYLLADAWAAMVGNMPVAIPLRVLAPTILVFAVMGVLRGYFQGKRTMLPTALSQLVEQIVNAIVSVYAAYVLMKTHNASVDVEAYGAAGGTFGSFGGAVFGLIILLLVYAMNRSYIRRKVRNDRTGEKETYGEILRAFVFTAIPIILSQTVYQLSATIDNALFGQLMQLQDKSTDTALLWGIYSNKYRLLTNLPVAIATALGTSIVPVLSNTYARGDDEGVREKIGAAVKLNMIIAIPAAVGMGVLSRPIIMLLFHSTEIELSSRLLSFGASAIIFFAYSTLTNGMLQGIDRMKLPVYHAAISLVLHVILVVVLLSVFHLSVYALVAGNVVYAFCVSLLNWTALRRHAGYHQEIKKSLLLPLLCSAVMGAVAYLCYNAMYLAAKSNLLALIFAIFVAVLCYGFLLLITGALSEEEIRSFPKGASLVHLLKRTHLLH